MVSGQLGLRYQYMVKFTILFTQVEAYFFHVGSPSGFFFRGGKPESGFGAVLQFFRGHSGRCFFYFF